MKELSVGEQRYRAVLAVLSGGRTATDEPSRAPICELEIAATTTKRTISPLQATPPKSSGQRSSAEVDGTRDGEQTQKASDSEPHAGTGHRPIGIGLRLLAVDRN